MNGVAGEPSFARPRSLPLIRDKPSWRSTSGRRNHQSAGVERADAIDASGIRVEVLNLPVVEGDPHRLAAALDNLINNALKHSRNPAGEHPGFIQVDSRVSEDEVWIFVSDNGLGIQPDHRERIFKLFQRGDPTGDGTGLGLAIVERVARIHGGRAWVEETPGGGATFVIALPRPIVSTTAARL